MIPCYALLEIKIGGELVRARPVAWNGADYDGQGNNADGEPLIAIAYHTTCPKCGQLVHFHIREVTDGVVACDACGASKNEVRELPSVAELLETKKTNKAKPGFVDPIEAALFDLEIVKMERLKELDQRISPADNKTA